MLTETLFDLADISLFKDLSAAQQRMIRPYLRERRYLKGESIFLNGKPCDHIFIIRSGRAKVSRTSVSGKEQILEVLNPGDTCACHAGVSSRCCSSSAQALTDCVILTFPREKYTALVRNDAKAAFCLSEIFAQKLRKLSARLEGVALDDPKRRLAKFILDHVDETVPQPHIRPTIDFPFTHEQIAQQLGLARETVSRLMGQFRNTKLIACKAQRLTVVNLAGLARVLE